MTTRIFPFFTIAAICLTPVLAVLAADPPALSKKEINRAVADAFFTNGTIVRLAIEASDEAIESLRKSPREYVRVNLREGDIVHSNIAVHLKGGSGSFRKVDDRPGFTLDFNRYQSGARFHGLKKMHLNNGAQDPSRLSELIGGQLFREAGVPAARAAHALVELNGRRLGLYVALESMDSEFLDRNFKDKSGNLYGQTRSCDITNQIERMEGDAPLTYDDLNALASAVLETNVQTRLEKLPQKLDLDRFISFMAMEILLVHSDGYTFNRHNYRLYRDPATDQFTFLPHDLDQLMRRPNLGFQALPRGLAAQAVMNTPELRARYQQRIGELAANYFVVSRLTSRVDQAVAAVLPALQAYDPEIAATFTNTAVEFKSRIANRGANLQRQMDILNGRIPAVAFNKGTAPLTAWRADTAPPAVAQLARKKADDRKPALWVKLGGTNTLAVAWRTQVLLEPGCYRFEGLAQCRAVAAQRKRRGEGAGLYANGFRVLDPFRLTGDLTWQKLSAIFEVTARDDVELVCELRADQGEAWFAEDSLQLVRLPADTVANLVAREKRSQQAATTTLEKAMASVKAATPEAAKDRQRPAFHFRPPAQWMNDVSGAVYYQGRYHVFFQFNPWADTSGNGTGWGHARSRDLVRWEFLSPALLPDAENGSILDGAGCATLDGYGSPILFYTHTPQGYPKNKREQWAALPEDETLLRWRRVNIGLAPGTSGVPRGISPSWADMYAWRSGGRVFATFKESKGLVCEALNPALTQWQTVGNLPEVAGERPNFFALDGRHVLINSAYPINYRVGDFDTNKIAFRSRDKEPRVLDYGAGKKSSSDSQGLSGTTVFRDAKDRAILLGWIGGFKTNQSWNGIMSLPRVLRLNGDQLIQEPLPELTQLRGRLATLKPQSLNRTNKLVDLVRGDMIEVSVEIKPGTAKAFGIRLRGGPAGPEEVVIRQSADSLNVAGREVPHIQPAGQVFNCRFYFDRSVLEAFFADGRIAVTRVLYPSTADLRLEVFAEEGDIFVQKLEAWPIRPTW